MDNKPGRVAAIAAFVRGTIEKRRFSSLELDSLRAGLLGLPFPNIRKPSGELPDLRYLVQMRSSMVWSWFVKPWRQVVAEAELFPILMCAAMAVKPLMTTLAVHFVDNDGVTDGFSVA